VRIFQVLEFNQFNTGSVHQMFQAAEGLRARGHEVTIVSRPDDTLRARAEDAGIEFAGMPLRNQFDVLSMLKMRRLVRAKRPDVIHVHKGVAQAILARLSSIAACRFHSMSGIAASTARNAFIASSRCASRSRT